MTCRFLRNLFSSRAKTVPVLAQHMSSDTHVHRPSDPAIWAAQDEPHRRRLVAGPDMADGVLVCGCGHESRLIHWGGNHPLRHVKCHSCKRVFNMATCVATPIFKVEQEANVQKAILADASAADCHGRMCASCGQTHRASSPGFHGSCGCGVIPSSKDFYFFLGSPKSYRRDPDEVVQSLRIQRVQAPHQQYPDERPSAPVSARVHTLHYLKPLGRQGAIHGRPQAPAKTDMKQLPSRQYGGSQQSRSGYRHAPQQLQAGYAPHAHPTRRPQHSA